MAQRVIVILPDSLAAQLCAVCTITGDALNDVIVDALTLHLDELDCGAAALPEPAFGEDTDSSTSAQKEMTP